MKRACADADDYDAFGGWRRVHFWQRGELRKLKRRASKRERRRGDDEIRQQREREVEADYDHAAPVSLSLRPWRILSDGEP